jgi:hypothetical protein
MSDFIIPRTDMRRLRAQQLVAAVMHVASKYVESDEGDSRRELYYELFALLHENGVEILTDADRAEMGLPPRGPDGWTVEELIAREKWRIECLARPLQHFV